MDKLNECQLSGNNTISEYVGEMIVAEMEQNPQQAAMLESFKEDNTMGNSGAFYTTVMAKKVFYTAYTEYQQYFDAVVNYTPADLGSMEGAGAYKIPKVLGSTAAKIGDGQIVPYVNDLKTEVTLETETYGIGTKITRRLTKRAAKGAIKQLLVAASDSVMVLIAQDIANSMIVGAASANTETGGVSYDTIEEAKYNIKISTNSKGNLLGLRPKMIAFSALGKKTLLQSTDFKNVMYRASVPGSEEQKNKYVVWQSLKVLDFDLITVQKGAADVHAIVFDNDKFFAFLKETGMDTYDGRLPGTAGDMESIIAIDCGMVVTATEGGAVITA